jgi:hypothetical protein
MTCWGPWGTLGFRSKTAQDTGTCYSIEARDTSTLGCKKTARIGIAPLLEGNLLKFQDFIPEIDSASRVQMWLNDIGKQESFLSLLRRRLLRSAGFFSRSSDEISFSQAGDDYWLQRCPSCNSDYSA